MRGIVTVNHHRGFLACCLQALQPPGWHWESWRHDIRAEGDVLAPSWGCWPVLACLLLPSVAAPWLALLGTVESCYVRGGALVEQDGGGVLAPSWAAGPCLPACCLHTLQLPGWHWEQWSPAMRGGALVNQAGWRGVSLRPPGAGLLHASVAAPGWHRESWSHAMRRRGRTWYAGQRSTNGQEGTCYTGQQRSSVIISPRGPPCLPSSCLCALQTLVGIRSRGGCLCGAV